MVLYDSFYSLHHVVLHERYIASRYGWIKWPIDPMVEKPQIAIPLFIVFRAFFLFFLTNFFLLELESKGVGQNWGVLTLVGQNWEV